jgi:hypothetical protein
VTQEAEGRYLIEFTALGSIYPLITVMGVDGTPTFALTQRVGNSSYMITFSTGAFNPATDAITTPYGFSFQGVLPLNNEP